MVSTDGVWGLTSTELVVGAVTVEVVTLAVLAAVDLGRVLPLLTLARAAHAVAVVAADVGAVVLPAVGVQVLGAHLVFAALAQTPDAALVTPGTGRRGQRSVWLLSTSSAEKHYFPTTEARDPELSTAAFTALGLF